MFAALKARMYTWCIENPNFSLECLEEAHGHSPVRRLLLTKVLLTSLIALVLTSCNLLDSKLEYHGKCTADHNFLVVEIDYQGKKYHFMLDSGSTLNIYSEEMFDAMPRKIGKVTGTDTMEEMRLALFQAVDAKIGSFGIGNEWPILILPSDVPLLDDIRDNDDIQGVLGMAFLKDKVLYYDPKKEVFELTSEAWKEQKWDFEFKIEYNTNNAPYFLAKINDSWQLPVFIDTGSNISIEVTKALFARIVSQEKITDVLSKNVTMASGIYKQRYLRLDSISLVGMLFHGIEFFEFSRAQIGIELLRKREFCIDFKRSILYINKSDSQVYDRLTKIGLWFKRVNNEILIIGVLSDSPASRAGIVLGGILKSINGRRTEGMSFNDIVGELHGEDVKLEIAYKGKSKVFLLERLAKPNENIDEMKK
jgi:hypothetical protein